MDYRVLAASLFAGTVICCVWVWAEVWNLHRIRASYRRRWVSFVRTAGLSRPLPMGRVAANARASLDAFTQVSSAARAQQSAVLSPASVSRTRHLLPTYTPSDPEHTGLPIETLAEFRLVHRRATGVIVITGRGSRARAHLTDCPSLTDDNFTKKVITNQGRGGSYFYFAHFDDAAGELDARWCKICAQPGGASSAQVDRSR